MPRVAVTAVIANRPGRRSNAHTRFSRYHMGPPDHRLIHRLNSFEATFQHPVPPGEQHARRDAGLAGDQGHAHAGLDALLDQAYLLEAETGAVAAPTLSPRHAAEVRPDRMLSYLSEGVCLCLIGYRPCPVQMWYSP
jgi:hypothetical protein